ncbi:MAG: hypothetical protein ACRCTP_04675 [Aeromonas popoffii]|uniref:hypothetical protein n=1 Tax=Aeromonas popoffii TaxID=70856 RepID=UPI003F3094E5
MSMIPMTRNSSLKKAVYNALEDDTYEARIVRFIGLGVQEQPEWNGEKKDPAFKCAIQFELIGIDATGTDSEGKALDPRPACQFKDYFLFPGAKRGGVFDLCKAIDPTLEKVPNDLNWFLDKVGAPIMVSVSHYVNKEGRKVNKVTGVSGMSARARNTLPAAQTDLVGFDPYKDTPEMGVAYAKMFKFQRDMLTEAHDSKNMPFAGTEAQKLDGNAPSKPAAQPAAPQSTGTPTAQQQADMPFDDDIPF